MPNLEARSGIFGRGGGTAGKADFMNTFFFFFSSLAVAVVKELVLTMFVSLVFAAWGDVRAQVFLA